MEVISRPCYCIIHNLPFIYDKDGKPASDSYKRVLKDILENFDFKPKNVTPVWYRSGYQRFAIIEFGREAEDYVSAFKLEWQFKNEAHGKEDWMSGEIDDRPYLWVATFDDRRLLRKVNVDFRRVRTARWREAGRIEAQNEILDAFGSIQFFFSVLHSRII